MKKFFMASLLGSAIALCTSAMAAGTDLKALEDAARKEGTVNSVGMPDALSLIHISEPTRREWLSRMPSSA